jgi:hypothetical protein
MKWPKTPLFSARASPKPQRTVGTTIAVSQGRRKIMPRFWNAALLCAALAVPIAIAPTALRAEDEHKSERKYHDSQHNDDHEWNSHEDQAYRRWAKENHRKYRDFSRLKDDDRQQYWSWRHEHSDDVQKREEH